MNDIQQFLSHLLVSDRMTLLFLHRQVHSAEDVQNMASLEEAAAQIANHVAKNFGRAPVSLKRLLSSPASVSSPHRNGLIRLLGFYRDPSCLDGLMGILRQLAFASSHPAAIRSLTQSQGVNAGRKLLSLLWSTDPAQWHVRETAILRELGQLGQTSSIPHLIKALAVRHDNPVRAAAVALASFDPAEVLEPLGEVIELWRSPENARQVAGAAMALGLLKDPRGISMLQRVGGAGPKGDRGEVLSSEVATAVAVALARLGDEAAERRLVRLAHADRGHRDAEIRMLAIEALGFLASRGVDSLSEGAFNTLFQGLRDSQPEVRTAAARALGASARTTASFQISSALQREVSPLVRRELVYALGRLGHSKSVGHLLECLARDDVGVKVQALAALGNFKDPKLAKHITPFRSASNQQVAEAADSALRMLMHRPFVWPAASAPERETRISLYSVDDARRLLLPPRELPPPPGFLGRLFGKKVPEAEAEPTSIGALTLTSLGLELRKGGRAVGAIDWSRRFSLQVTREPIKGSEPGRGDIGVHFVLRQRERDSAASFQAVGVSFWCAPSAAAGRLVAKSERLDCLDPHMAKVFLAALRWYMEVQGEPIVGA